MKTIILSLISIASLLIAPSAHAQFWQGEDASFHASLWGERVYAIDDDVAWTYGVELNQSNQPTYRNTIISRTANAGEYWYNVVFPTTKTHYMTSIWALDIDTVWATLLEYPHGISNVGINKLYASTDGGIHWDSVPIPTMQFINFIYMWNSLEGVIVSDPAGGKFEIFATADGGQSWKRIINLPEALPDEYLDRDNYIVHGDQIWFVSTLGRVFFSPSRGQYWGVWDAPPDSVYLNWTMAANEAGDVLLSYVLFDGPNGQADNRLWKRDVQSGEWSIALHDYYFFYDIQYVPGTDALILTTSSEDFEFGTRLSLDNGNSWMVVDTQSKAAYVSFYDSNTGYATDGNYAWDQSETQIYRYEGSPLTGLINQVPLANASLSIFPNPSTTASTITFQSSDADPYWLLIHDLKGNLMYKKEYALTNSFSEKVRLDHWPPGNYMLTVSSPKGSVTKQIVKP